MRIEIFVLVIYFIALALIGTYSFFKAKTAGDFYAAGKKGTVMWVSGSLIATILGGSAIIGAVNWSSYYGWAVSWFLLTGSLGLALLLPFVKYVVRYGKFTLPELLEKFYGKEVKLMASLIIPIAWIGIIAAQFTAASKILNGFFATDFTSGVIIAGIIFILYTILGGQISILKTDLLQTVLIITGIFLIFIIILRDYKGSLGTITPLGFPFNKAFGPLSLIVLLFTYASTYFVGPDIYSRLFCAKNEDVARRSIIITILVLVPMAFILGFIGVYTSANYTFDPSSQSGLVIAIRGLHEKLPGMLPSWMMGLLIAALLSVVMSSADTTLLTASTILGEVFVKPEDKKSLLLTRCLIGVIGGCSLLFALYLEKSIIDSLLYALTVFSASFIIPTAAGLLGYRGKKPLVITAIGVGGIISLIGKLIEREIIPLPGGKLTGNLVIMASFCINGAILFIPLLFKKNPGNAG